MDVRIAQFVCGSLADRADFYVVELIDFDPALVQAAQEVFDGVGAGKDEPVVAVEMVDGFVEAFVSFGCGDLDRRTNDDLRTVLFELADEVSGLCRGARDDGGERGRAAG